MDKFEEKDTMKKLPIRKNNWYNWLMNYIRAL